MKGDLGRQLLVGLAAALLLVGCTAAEATPSSGGSTPSIAPTTSATELSASPSAAPTSADSAAVAKAARIIEALGETVPADSTPLVLPADPVRKETGTYVEIGSWQVAWNAKGVLHWVFLMPPSFSSDPATKLTSTAAGARVTRVLTALGVTLGTPESLAYEDNMPDWVAEWPRKVDGVPVEGEGTTVRLGPDGRFLAYKYSESELAAKPAKPLTKSQALAKAPYCKNSKNGPNGKTESCTVELVWYRQMAAQPDDPLRLYWRVSYSWADNDQNHGGSRIYIDAGTGEAVDVAAIM